MPRPKKELNISNLSPGHLRYIIESALQTSKIRFLDVEEWLSYIPREVERLEDRLRSLRDAAVEPIQRVLGRRPGRPAKASPGRKRRANKPASAEVQASRKLQGQYIAAIRQLPKNKRAKFSAMAKKDGREAVIAAIKKLK